MECNQPHLGLATTRELLRELEVRGEVNVMAGHYPIESENMRGVMAGLLSMSPDGLLDYRTVDGR
jgi:hypothetical protein